VTLLAGRHSQVKKWLDVESLSLWKLADLARAVHAEAHGDGAVAIAGVCGVENPRPGYIAMAETSEHLAALSDVAAILHGPALCVEGPGMMHPEPRLAFARLLEIFHPEPSYPPGIHSSATVDPRASVDPTAHIGPHCVVGPRATVGPGCVLQAFVNVGEDARIGPGCRLFAHVVVGRGSELGADCRLEPWAHVGNHARLEATVDVGAHSALGDGTEVGPGAKIDNLVVVGSGTRIGAQSLLVGQCSVGRSSVLHPGVVLAGQSAVSSGAELVSGVQLGGRSLAVGKLDQPGPYLGNPARPLKEEMRARARARKSGPL
jgi:UDP-3-O-[3-hydroxymyristoyl] glucosamine N-acyltransferase